MSESLFEPTTAEPQEEKPAVPSVASVRSQQLVAVMRTGGRASAWLIGLLMVVLVVLWQRVIYVVPAGGAGVVWHMFFGGTVIDQVEGEGLKIMFPWDRLTIYDTRVQTVDSDFTALTAKGLPIELKLTIRYHPNFDTIAILDQRVGKDFVNKVVKPTIQSVMRRSIGRLEPEAIYTNKEGVLSAMITRAIEETSVQQVSIDDLVIREVSLPEALRDAIAAKLVYQQQQEAYDFRIKAEEDEARRKKIEAQGISEANAIIRSGLTPELLRYEAIQMEGSLARSNNSKLIIMNGAETRALNLNVP